MLAARRAPLAWGRIDPVFGAFGRLKARFGALKRAMDINIEDLPFVIYACFVLHNFCEINKESISEERVRMAIGYDRDFQPPTAANRYRSECNEA
ncbi:MAG: hypothetical protein EB829_01555, partial [Nitrosopumilus sp. H8]